MAEAKKPLLLFCVTPVYGHLFPIKAIAKDLIERGYEVTFVTGSPYKDMLSAMGAGLVPLEGYSDFTELDLLTRWPEREKIAPGPEQLAYDMEQAFVNSIPSQYEAQQRALKLLKEQHPGRPIIALNEAAFLGAIPSMTGAPGLKADMNIGVGIVPVLLSSIDTAPFGPGLPPVVDGDPATRAQYAAMEAGVQTQLLGQAQKVFEKHLRDVGADCKGRFLFNNAYLCADRFLQMCIPSVEYPRSDAPETIVFAGSLPKGHRDAFANPPEWWDEIIENKAGKKIVAVSQGSVAQVFSDLVIPTMHGLAEEEDFLVVVALGAKGTTLPEGTIVPANARVLDFIPFDDLLPHCAVFITNGGYGAFQHAIGNGTPLIVGGQTEDKAEVAARAEWCGAGINLKTMSPTKEQVLEAVKEITSNPKYKKRSLELEAETKTFDSMGVVAATIEELAKKI